MRKLLFGLLFFCFVLGFTLFYYFVRIDKEMEWVFEDVVAMQSMYISSLESSTVESEGYILSSKYDALYLKSFVERLSDSERSKLEEIACTDLIESCQSVMLSIVNDSLHLIPEISAANSRVIISKALKVLGDVRVFYEKKKHIFPLKYELTEARLEFLKCVFLDGLGRERCALSVISGLKSKDGFILGVRDGYKYFTLGADELIDQYYLLIARLYYLSGDKCKYWFLMYRH